MNQEKRCMNMKSIWVESRDEQDDSRSPLNYLNKTLTFLKNWRNSNSFIFLELIYQFWGFTNAFATRLQTCLQPSSPTNALFTSTSGNGEVLSSYNAPSSITTTTHTCCSGSSTPWWKLTESVLFLLSKQKDKDADGMGFFVTAMFVVVALQLPSTNSPFFLETRES